MKKTAVSIIVPIYQGKDYLNQCLDSIKNQTFDLPYQVIIIDMGALEACSDIAKEYERKDPRFYYYRFPKNFGPGFSRNLGLMFARGEYVCFVDSDDVIDHNFLSAMYSKISKSNAALVTGGYYLFDEKHHIKGYSRKHKMTDGKTILSKIYHSPFLKYRTFCWGRLYRRAFLMEHHLTFDVRLEKFEDWYFISQVLYYADKVVFIKSCLYGYRKNNSSIMSSSKGRVEQHLLAIEKTKNFLDQVDLEYSKKLFNHLSWCIKTQLNYDRKAEGIQDKKSVIKKLKSIFKKR